MERALLPRGRVAGRGPGADRRSGAGISAAGSWTPRTTSTQQGGGRELALRVLTALPGTAQLQGPPRAAASQLAQPVLLRSRACQSRGSREDAVSGAMISTAPLWSTRGAAAQHARGRGREQVLRVVPEPQEAMQLPRPSNAGSKGAPAARAAWEQTQRSAEWGADPHGTAMIPTACLWSPWTRSP